MILFNILNFYLLFDSFYSREIVSKHTIWLLKLNFLAFSHVGGVEDFLILARCVSPPVLPTTIRLNAVRNKACY